MNGTTSAKLTTRWGYEHEYRATEQDSRKVIPVIVVLSDHSHDWSSDMKDVNVIHDKVGVYSYWNSSIFHEAIQEPWLTR